jgi:hypothetical protein
VTIGADVAVAALKRVGRHRSRLLPLRRLGGRHPDQAKSTSSSYAGTIVTPWQDAPRQVLLDLCAALRAEGFECTITTHAIKFTFSDVAFAADVVFGCTHPEQDLWIAQHILEGVLGRAELRWRRRDSALQQ